MADNSKYALGFDLYDGNGIKSWAALAKACSFLYLRTSIGIVPDGQFIGFSNAADLLHIPIGGFHQMWPNFSISAQVRTIKTQLTKAGVLTFLPLMLAYEKEPVKDKKGNVTDTWPNPNDIGIFAQQLGMGEVAEVYTNMTGLGIIHDAKINTSKWKFWLADYMEHQGRDGEYPVEVLLANVLKEYGISKEQVLFVQTANALPYPPGISDDKGADYDRAVSFPLTPPTPTPPPPSSSLEQRVGFLETSMASEIQTVNNLVARVTVLENKQPPPPPEPSPQPIADLWTLKTLDEAGVPHNGSYASFGGHGRTNAILLRKPETDLIRRIAPNSELWNWAVAPSGRLYISTDDPNQIWWPVVVMSSTPTDRQIVHVLNLIDGNTVVARLEGIRQSKDYSQYDPDKQPWLFAKCYTGFKGGGFGPSHNGKTFIMPLFDPRGGFPIKAGTMDFWIPAALLKEKIS